MSLLQKLHVLLSELGPATAEDLYEELEPSDIVGKKPSSLLRLMRTRPDNFNELGEGLFEVKGAWTEQAQSSAVQVHPVKVNDAEARQQVGSNSRGQGTNGEYSTVSPLTWRELERDLRDQLRGRRLVAEIPIDARLVRDIEEVLPRVMTTYGSVDRFARHVPSILVVYLVAHGIYKYRGGTFWSGFGVEDIDNSYGKIFISLLDLLGLETFEQMVEADNSLRFVSPILAHGGVPKTCAPAFLELIAKALQLGISDADDLLSVLRSDDSWLRSITKPVRRFILYGGSLATDYLARSMDLITIWSKTRKIPSPDEVGLPAYMVSEFRRLTQSGQFSTKSRTPGNRRQTFPIAVRCDIEEGLGIRLELPAVPHKFGTAHWVVVSDHRVESHAASAYIEASIPLKPARHWRITLVQDDIKVFERTIEGIDKLPALFFDSATGNLMPSGLGLRSESVFVLHPRDTQIRLLNRGHEVDRELSHIFDGALDWSGYECHEVGLQGASTLLISSGDADRSSSRVRSISIQHREKPSLTSTPLPNINTDDGQEIYVDAIQVQLPPSEIPWTGTAVVNGETFNLTEDQLTARYLGGIIPDSQASDVDLIVRGPLGSDLRKHFLSIPNLSISVPDRLVLPNDKNVGISVTSPTVPIASDTELRGDVLLADDSSDSIELTVEIGGENRVLRGQVSRLKWGISDGAVPELRSKLIQLNGNDFESMASPALSLVAHNREFRYMPLLELHDGTRIELKSSFVRAGRSAKINLRALLDTVRELTDPAVLSVQIDSIAQVKVAVISAPFLVRDITATETVVKSKRCLSITFETGKNVSHRTARLWNVGRPWSEHIDILIGDDASSPISVPLPESALAGTYDLEICVDDGWTTPVRPASGAPATARVQIGDPEAHLARIVISAANGDGLSFIEHAALTHMLPVVPTPEIIQPVAHELLLAWINARRQKRNDNVYVDNVGLSRLLRVAGDALVEPIVDLSQDGILDEQGLLELALVLARFYQPQPISGDAIETLWSLEPALAIILDGNPMDPTVENRCKSATGWGASEGTDSIEPGDPLVAMWQLMELDQLESIRSHVQFEVIPRPLTIDGRVDAWFEWLKKQKGPEMGLLADWCRRYGQLEMYKLQSRRAYQFVYQSRADNIGNKWAEFPQLLLQAAFISCSNSQGAELAQSAVAAAAAFAPKQVRRDLIIARTLQNNSRQNSAHPEVGHRATPENGTETTC